MNVFITNTSFALIVTDEKFNVIDYLLFDNNRLDFLKSFEDNFLLDEEVDFISKICEDYDEVIIEGNLIKYSSMNYDNLSVIQDTSHGKFVRNNLDNLLDNVDRYNSFNEDTNAVFNEFVSDKIRDSIKNNDVMIIESINSLGELEDTTGKLIERLRTWCMPFVPELDKLHNHKLYARIISEETTRENIVNNPLLDNTHISFSDSYIVDMSEEDEQIIRDFAGSVYRLYESKDMLERFIDHKVKEVAPNLYSIAGSNLAARLIAHTNGLENLAKLPSSTVQIIGAEKAMFRHLKTGEKPPKHGLIYQHPSIRSANWWVRGKLARTLAGKISIAARRDAFSGIYDDSLREDLDNRINKIIKDHPFPERKNNDKKDKKDKKNKKHKKDKHKKSKRNKRKLKKGEYSY